MSEADKNVVDSNQIALADRAKAITTAKIQESQNFLLGLEKKYKKTNGTNEKTDDEREI
jgi:hypothetical protein